MKCIPLVQLLQRSHLRYQEIKRVQPSILDPENNEKRDTLL